MKTSTMMWTLAILIILLGAGAYLFTGSPAAAPTTTVVNTTATNSEPLPTGDMAPVPTKPIGSSTTVGASSTVHVQ